MRENKDALICDLAETYHIYDYKRLPALTVAVLAVGLKEDSRIKMQMSGRKVPMMTILTAAIFDQLSFIAWSKTKDAEKGINRPKLLTEALGLKSERQELVFNSGKEFDEKREEMLRQIRRANGN